MDGRALNKRVCRRAASLALSTVCLLSFSLAPSQAKKSSQHSAPQASSGSGAVEPTLTPAPSTPDSAPQVVQSFEQRLFFKTFPDESLEARVDRIEKHVFGEALSASMQERLSRLEQIFQQQQAEDRAKQEAQAHRQAAEQAKVDAANRARQQKYDAEDQMERARAQIQAAREQEIDSLLADGVNLYRAKRGAQAQDKFEQVLRLDPQNAQAHFNLGIIEESRGNYIEALASYRQAAQGEPENKEYSEAVAAVERKASVQQKTAGKRAELRTLAENANAAWKRGEFASALDMYQQLDQKEPNKALVKYNIGSIYLMLKDQISALDYYKQAAKLEPAEAKYKQAYARLSAEVQRSQQEQDQVNQEAMTDYNQAHGVPAPPTNQPEPPRGKKNKKDKHAQQAQQPQMPNSPFAQFVGTNSNQNGMVRGRSSFGVNPGMQQRFNPTNSANPGGVMMAPPPPSSNAMASYGLMGRPNGEGVTVTNVGLASRAAQAGIVPGDDIKAVDGVQVSSPDEINRVLMQKNRAERVPVLIMRKGNLAVLNI